MSTTDVYEELRPLAFSIAYRMVGSVSEAEDLVQESFLRYHRTVSDGTAVESPKAYVSAVTTRLAIDHLRSARVRRETYLGEWLPEPLLTDSGAFDPASHAEIADSISMAFLLLLERLTPVERAVFLLHDVFAYSFDEIADIVDKSPGNCRQLAHRARGHIAEDRPRFESTRKGRDRLAGQFFDAIGEGDLGRLIALLAEDAVVYGDSGGTAPNWPNPITGRDKVGRLLVSLGEEIRQLGVTMEPVEINGQPGALFLAPDGRLTNVFAIDIVDGAVRTIRSVINPDKLQHLGPLANVQELRARR